MEDYIIRHPDFSDVPTMKTLWIETFGDTCEYVDIVFDNYFNPRYCLCAFDRTQLIASMIGIPYNFILNDTIIRGLYLCGLATKILFRNKGIMGKMLNLIPDLCRINNLQFSFLIPADNHLRSYYKKFKYFDSAPIKSIIIKEDIVPIITQNISYIVCKKYEDESWDDTILCKYDITDVLKWNDAMWNTICSQCNTADECNGIHIQHSLKDWRLIITEKLLSGGLMVISYIKDVSNLFIIEKNGKVNILVGSVECVGKLLRQLISIRDRSVQEVSDLHMMEIPSQAVQKYGMVRLSKDFIEEYVLQEGCNENSIFENLLGIPRKYWKMKYEETGSIFNEILCRNIHFSYMLD